MTIQDLQTNIAGIDFTTLSQPAQTQVFNLLKQILSISIIDTMSNENTTSDQMASVITTLSAVQATLKTAVNNLNATPQNATPS